MDISTDDSLSYWLLFFQKEDKSPPLSLKERMKQLQAAGISNCWIVFCSYTLIIEIGHFCTNDILCLRNMTSSTSNFVVAWKSETESQPRKKTTSHSSGTIAPLAVFGQFEKIRTVRCSHNSRCSLFALFVVLKKAPFAVRTVWSLTLPFIEHSGLPFTATSKVS